MKKGKSKITYEIKFTIFMLLGILLVIFLGSYQDTGVPACFSQSSTSTVPIGIALNSIILNVSGTSMTPTIHNEDKCFCQAKSNYSVGDIVYYKIVQNETIKGVIHRIVEMNNSFAITKGDNNNFTDYQPVPIPYIECSVALIPRHEIN